MGAGQLIWVPDDRSVIFLRRGYVNYEQKKIDLYRRGRIC